MHQNPVDLEHLSTLFPTPDGRGKLGYTPGLILRLREYSAKGPLELPDHLPDENIPDDLLAIWHGFHKSNTIDPSTIRAGNRAWSMRYAAAMGTRVQFRTYFTHYARSLTVDDLRLLAYDMRFCSFSDIVVPEYIRRDPDGWLATYVRSFLPDAIDIQAEAPVTHAVEETRHAIHRHLQAGSVWVRTSEALYGDRDLTKNKAYKDLTETLQTGTHSTAVHLQWLHVFLRRGLVGDVIRVFFVDRYGVAVAREICKVYAGELGPVPGEMPPEYRCHILVVLCKTDHWDVMQEYWSILGQAERPQGDRGKDMPEYLRILLKVLEIRPLTSPFPARCFQGVMREIPRTSPIRAPMSDLWRKLSECNVPQDLLVQVAC
jgi:hypothetical protein